MKINQINERNLRLYATTPELAPALVAQLRRLLSNATRSGKPAAAERLAVQVHTMRKHAPRLREYVPEVWQALRECKTWLVVVGYKFELGSTNPDEWVTRHAA
jgi:hypothetical protein